MKIRKRFSILISILFLLVAGGGGAYFIMTTGGQTVSTGSLNKGLIAHYPLDSESMRSTTVFADTSGNSRHGTITPGASAGLSTDQHGQAAKAYDFDGANTKIDTGSNWIGTGNITISGWIYVDAIAAGGPRIISNISQAGISGRYIRIESDGVGGYKLGNGAQYSGNNSIMTNQWIHFVYTYSTSGTYSNFYINGLLSGTANQAGTTYAGNSNVIIGNVSMGSSPFNGRITGVRVYNRVLSAAEMAQLYQSYRPKLRMDCASVVDSDGRMYSANKIGTQCWMTQHMNAGTKIDDPGAAAITAACTGHVGEVVTIGGLSAYCTAADQASLQRNGAGGTTQKYCYSNTEANCTAEGGLYEWQEAMDLAANCAYTDCSGSITTPHRGICPVGWHIPTDTEWKTLEGTIGMSVAQQDASGWRGTTEGDKLKVANECFGGVSCNSSGFSALMAGYRYRTGGFYDGVSILFGWSSSQNSATDAWRRLFGSGYATVYRGTHTKVNGFSVRCLKD